MSDFIETYHRELTISSQLAKLAQVRSFIELCSSECGFDQATAEKIALAVDEACSNLIRHAYHLDPRSSITLRVESGSKGVIISIIDAATSFDPLQVQTPDMPEYFATFKSGGLGVQLIKRIMDKIEYFPSSTKQPQNELRLTKLYQ